MNKPTVVIIGNSANALGALRSLTHCNLILLCDTTNAPAWHSRFGRKVLVDSTKTAGIVQDLLKLAKENSDSKPILLLTEERTVLIVSESREQLAPYYNFLLSPHEQILSLQSKAGFALAAERAGSPIPRGVTLNSELDLKSCEELSYPCVLKPLQHNENYSKYFKKAYKVESADEVRTLYEKISTVTPELIVQEWLFGSDSDICFCIAYYDSNSKLVQSFTGRKLRSWPLQVGGTASCTAAPDAEIELEALTTSFVTKSNYVGLIGMEYKYDAIRGGYFMIEPTVGRTDYQHEIATLSGCNVLAQMVASLIGDPTIVQPASPFFICNKVVWYDEIADANALANGAPNKLYLDYSRIAAVWRWSDPKPGLMSLWRRLKSKLS